MANARSHEVNVVAAVRAKPLRAAGDPSSSGGEVASLLAHDLKTPLAAIAMNLDFVLSELQAEVPGALRSALDDCRHANARAIRIVSDMADVARLAAGDYAPAIEETTTADLLEGVARRAAEEASARSARLSWSADARTISVDAGLLARALDRLVERALKLTRTGGSLTIDCAQGVIEIQTETTPDCRAEAVPRALGLSFAEAAVRAHGGRLAIDTGEPGALAYRVTLPTLSP